MDSGLSARDEEENRVKEEYATQYYGFSVAGLVEGIEAAFLEQSQEVVSVQMEHGVEKGFIDRERSELTKSSINGVYERSIEKAFQRLETYLEDVCSIPSNVLLPEDAVQHTQYTKEVQVIDNQISQLQKEFLSNKYSMEMLMKEAEIIESMMQDEGQVLKKKAKLDEIDLLLQNRCTLLKPSYIKQILKPEFQDDSG